MFSGLLNTGVLKNLPVAIPTQNIQMYELNLYRANPVSFIPLSILIINLKAFVLLYG